MEALVERCVRSRNAAELVDLKELANVVLSALEPKLKALIGEAMVTRALVEDTSDRSLGISGGGTSGLAGAHTTLRPGANHADPGTSSVTCDSNAPRLAPSIPLGARNGVPSGANHQMEGHSPSKGKGKEPLRDRKATACDETATAASSRDPGPSATSVATTAAAPAAHSSHISHAEVVQLPTAAEEDAEMRPTDLTVSQRASAVTRVTSHMSTDSVAGQPTPKGRRRFAAVSGARVEAGSCGLSAPEGTEYAASGREAMDDDQNNPPAPTTLLSQPEFSRSVTSPADEQDSHCHSTYVKPD